MEQLGAAAGLASPAAKKKAGYIKVTVKSVKQALVIGVEMELKLAKICRCSQKPSAAVAAGISQAGSLSSRQRSSAGSGEGSHGANGKREQPGAAASQGGPEAK
jgi:hypothetical protein